MPGLVTSPLAAGTNALIADGAQLVRGAHDVLELLFGAGRAAVLAAAPADRTAGLGPTCARCSDRVGGGRDTVAALTATDGGVDAVLAGLAQLELRGRVRRGPVGATPSRRGAARCGARDPRRRGRPQRGGAVGHALTCAP